MDNKWAEIIEVGDGDSYLIKMTPPLHGEFTHIKAVRKNYVDKSLPHRFKHKRDSEEKLKNIWIVYQVDENLHEILQNVICVKKFLANIEDVIATLRYNLINIHMAESIAAVLTDKQKEFLEIHGLDSVNLAKVFKMWKEHTQKLVINNNTKKKAKKINDEDEDDDDEDEDDDLDYVNGQMMNTIKP